MSMNSINPSYIFGGKWVEIGQGRVLMGRTDNNAAGTTIDSGLPDIQGQTDIRAYGEGLNSGWGGIENQSGAFIRAGTQYFKNGWSTTWQTTGNSLGFKASQYNSIYGSSSIVQPPALFCYMFQRTE